MMINGNGVDATHTSQPSGGNNFSKIMIGALIGGTLGSIAAALANRQTAERVNQTIRSVGQTAKSAAETLNDSVRQVGQAVNQIAVTVNESAQDVNSAVNSIAMNANTTAQDTIRTVQGAAAEVNASVNSTMNVVNAVKSGASNIQQSASTSETVSTVNDEEKYYKLIPVSAEEIAR